MVVHITMFLSHLYGDFLCMYIWSKILGNRYSKRITIGITFLHFLVRYSFKMNLFLEEGFVAVLTSTVMTYLTYIFYIIIMFRSTIGKKLLILTVTLVIMIFMDILASVILIELTGRFEFMQVESLYTVTYAIVGNIFITVGLFLLYYGIVFLGKLKWEVGWYQWLSILLPLSQWFVLIRLGMKYSVYGMSIPIVSVAGFLLGLVADLYMLVLFKNLNSRIRLERELRKLNHQYELERMRYEQLKANQKEVAKIRHDFQNYILTIKNME